MDKVRDCFGAMIDRRNGERKTEKFEHESALRVSAPGVATGMAWTQAGGELLFIEASKMKGSGSVVITGSLGDVMKESAKIAQSWIRANADLIGDVLGISAVFLF